MITKNILLPFIFFLACSSMQAHSVEIIDVADLPLASQAENVRFALAMCEQNNCSFNYYPGTCAGERFEDAIYINQYAQDRHILKKLGNIQFHHIKYLFIDGIKAGFIIYFKHPTQALGCVDYIAIDRSLRGKGYGTLLMNHAIEALHQAGCEIVELFLTKPNLKGHGCPAQDAVNGSINFFRKFGFSPAESSRWHLLHMVKVLNPHQ